MNDVVARTETLPRLIAKATAALEKATTAAEILEAKAEADVAYTAAKTAARFAKLTQAHQTIIAACHRAQADALVIEARAQCRLADEYDAAQERGEVQKGGNKSGRRGNTIPNENSIPRVDDIGLTSKQVHEARAVRDAEKAKPGVIRKVLDEQLEAGHEPTRADVKRAIAKPDKSKGQRSKGNKKPPQVKERQDKVVQLFDQGLSSSKIAKEVNLGQRMVDRILEVEQARRDGQSDPMIDPAALSLTAQQKLEAAIRQAKRKLEIEFEARVQAECKRRLDDVALPHYKKTLEQLERWISNRQGIMDRITYRKILSCLHPDRIADKALKPRYEEAFRLFTELEKRVLNEKESPTQFQKMPTTYEELMAQRAKVQADRKARRVNLAQR